MNATGSAVPAFSPEQKQAGLWGGAASLVLAVGYVVIIPLYAHVGAPPSGAEAFFNYLPAKTAT